MNRLYRTQLVVLLLMLIALPASGNALIKAVQTGSLVEVKKAIATIANIDAVDDLSNTALHYAALLGDSAIVDYLLGADANAQRRNGQDKLPFQLATEEQKMTVERIKTIALLLYATKGAEGRDQKGWTALYWAILAKDRPLIDRFLAAGSPLVRHADLSRLDRRQHAIEIALQIKDQQLQAYLINRYLAAEGENAVKSAVKYNLYSLVEILIERGFLENEEYMQPDDRVAYDGVSAEYGYYTHGDYYGHEGHGHLYNGDYYDSSSVINLAIRTKNPRLVALLLDNGLSPDGDGSAITPIEAALKLGVSGTPILKLLVAYGANIAQSTRQDWNRMMLAVAAEDLEFLDTLIAEFFKIKGHSLDKLFEMMRDWYGEVKLQNMLKALIKHGLDLQAHAAPLLHKAIAHDNKILFEWLLQQGLDVEALNDKGNTPLLEAVTRGHFLHVELLLQYGASRDATTAEGITAIGLNKMNIERMQDFHNPPHIERHTKIRELLAD
ncbi:MAG: ankyrin repeat domain-containing protein [Pseudomonadota bacterium]|nr:ankyrin repeat domain-containing protein [Pseudomonadota bacterium]